MMIHKPLMAAGMASLLMSLSLATTQARADTNFHMQMHVPLGVVATPMVSVQYAPPPPPRHERIPAPRRGMVWSQGHWEWRGHHQVWIPGQWIQVRSGYRYRQPEWVRRDGRWYFNEGRWYR